MVTKVLLVSNLLCLLAKLLILAAAKVIFIYCACSDCSTAIYLLASLVMKMLLGSLLRINHFGLFAYFGLLLAPTSQTFFSTPTFFSWLSLKRLEQQFLFEALAGIKPTTSRFLGNHTSGDATMVVLDYLGSRFLINLCSLTRRLVTQLLHRRQSNESSIRIISTLIDVCGVRQQSKLNNMQLEQKATPSRSRRSQTKLRERSHRQLFNLLRANQAWFNQ